MKWQNANLIVVTCVLTILMGCSSEEHDDHLEHHIPEHKPGDFSQAVTQIERRTVELRSADKLSTADRTTKVNELFDIIRWLPELAGESDMPEEPWNQVNAISRSLASTLDPLRQAGAGGEKLALPAAEAWGNSLRELHDLVPLSRPAIPPVENSHGS